MPEHRGLSPRHMNREAILPYGVTVDEVGVAVRETYRLMDGIDSFLIENGFKHLEELILGNSLSGILSEFLVKNVAAASAGIEANVKVGGHPDLLPCGHYESNSVLRGTEGVEIKASIQRGGWQGHNPEECCVMVFRYSPGHYEEQTWVPLTFVEVLCARLSKDNWSYSGRKGASRRTPTASITESGVEKLRCNFVYRLPKVGVGRHRQILAGCADGGA